MNAADFMKKYFPLLESVAPTLAMAIGGPWASAASLAIKVLAHAFQTTDANELFDKIKCDSENNDCAILKKAEETHKEIEKTGNIPASIEVDLKIKYDPQLPKEMKQCLKTD